MFISSDPGFEQLQATWYARLAAEDFEDIEDWTRADRPLKEWVGSARVLSKASKGQEISILLSRKEEFSNHPQFDSVCAFICEHGNFSLTKQNVCEIWRTHCEGQSLRAIAKQLKSSFKTVHRTILKIREWMDMLGTGEESVAPAHATIVIRPMTQDDAPMIYSSWRHSLWYDGLNPRATTQSQAFYAAATKAIRALLARPGVKVRIATLSDDPNFIAGYSVLEGPHLHWVFVKRDYFRKGIGSLLTQGFQTAEPPLTRIGKTIFDLHHLKLREETNG